MPGYQKMPSGPDCGMGSPRPLTAGGRWLGGEVLPLPFRHDDRRFLS